MTATDSDRLRATHREMTRELAEEYWLLYLQARGAGSHDMAAAACEAHFELVEHVARAQRPDLWETKC